MISFDVEAAFPSLDQDWMHRVLKHYLIPKVVRNVVKALYRMNYAVIVMAGKRFPGFMVTAGIRQGCPLSGSLFAIIQCADF